MLLLAVCVSVVEQRQIQNAMFKKKKGYVNRKVIPSKENSMSYTKENSKYVF